MSEDNIEDRADDYERRLETAGGTEPLMNGLVLSIKRTKLALILTSIGLTIDLILSGFLTVAVLRLLNAEEEVLLNTRQICQANQKASRDHNSLVDAVVASLSVDTVLPDPERDARIARYKATRTLFVVCK